jgi:hypothetical protein
MNQTNIKSSVSLLAHEATHKNLASLHIIINVKMIKPSIYHYSLQYFLYTADKIMEPDAQLYWE